MPSIEDYKDADHKLPDRFIRWLEQLRNVIRPIPNFYEGAGSPEGVVTARRGSHYFNTSGGAGTWSYIKTTNTGNTGWVAYA